MHGETAALCPGDWHPLPGFSPGILSSQGMASGVSLQAFVSLRGRPIRSRRLLLLPVGL